MKKYFIQERRVLELVSYFWKIFTVDIEYFNNIQIALTISEWQFKSQEFQMKSKASFTASKSDPLLMATLIGA